MAGSRALAAWRARVDGEWANVRVELASVCADAVKVGEEFQVQARVHLGTLKPEDVAVELYLGNVDASGELAGAKAEPMHLVHKDSDGSYLYQAGGVTCRRSGLFGYTDLATPLLPGLIAWA